MKIPLNTQLAMKLQEMADLLEQQGANPFIISANCQLPTANCQLPTANCQLPTAN